MSEQPLRRPPTNTDYNPGKDDGDPELVLNVLKTDAWPSVTPYRVVQRTADGFDKYDAHHALNSLVDAGWVHRRERGLYDLLVDPRDDVPSWPVPWEDAGLLPDPLPQQPEDDGHTDLIHQRYLKMQEQADLEQQFD